MNIIHATRKLIDLEDFKMRLASPDDCTRLIDESTAVYEDGQIKVVYEVLDTPYADITQALQSSHYEKGTHTGGMPSQSRIFGYEPRKTLRKDFCSATSLARDNPTAHQVICDYATLVSSRYQVSNPDLYAEHDRTTAEHVISDYRIKGGVFTSGIINKNNQLRYHFDTGNFKNVWSNMLVFKSDVRGGYLAVPEYDMLFELKNNSLLMFDGQGLLHGVTPIEYLKPDGFRYSIVYYSLRQMWNCLTIDDELIRIRKLKTARERKRAGK